MRSKVRRIGNSRGVLIPTEACEALGLKEGDDIEIALDANRMIMRAADGDGEDRADFIRAMDEVFDEDAKALDELSRR